MSPCYVLSANINVSLLCAVAKHQHLPAMCCWQAPMSPWYVLSTSNNVFLLCAVGKHQCLLAMCCSQLPKSTCFLWLYASTKKAAQQRSRRFRWRNLLHCCLPQKAACNIPTCVRLLHADSQEHQTNLAYQCIRVCI